MLADKLRKVLSENPEYEIILKKALEIEENPPDDFTAKYGWEWHQVQAIPAKLTRLVGEGILRIGYKSRRYTHYRLADREVVKSILQSRESPLEKALDVQRRYVRRLMEIPGVVGVGIGGTESRPRIVVSVAELTSELATKFPKEIEGIPVEILETGSIRALKR